MIWELKQKVAKAKESSNIIDILEVLVMKDEINKVCGRFKAFSSFLNDLYKELLYFCPMLPYIKNTNVIKIEYRDGDCIVHIKDMHIYIRNYREFLRKAHQYIGVLDVIMDYFIEKLISVL